MKRALIIFTATLISGVPAFADQVSPLNSMLGQTASCSELKTAWMPSSTLRAYYKLNDVLGSTSAIDSSGNSSTGTTSGAIVYGGAGRLNTAATFNGTNSYIDMGDKTALKASLPFSVSFWTKVNALPSVSAGLVGVRGTTSNWNYSGWQIDLDSSGHITSQVGNNAGNCGSSNRYTMQTTPSLSTGKFYFVTVVFSSATSHKIFVNGVAVAATSTGGTASSMVYATTTDFTLGFNNYQGASCAAGNVYYNGVLDEVAVWGGALSSADVRNLYDAQSCGKN